MKATISYKGLTVEIEGTPEEIAQYTDTLSKELNQPPDSTARANITWWMPPLWYQHCINTQGIVQESSWNTLIQNTAAGAVSSYQQFYDKEYAKFLIQIGGANPINPYQQFYDNCLPKWVSPLYATMGASLL